MTTDNYRNLGWLRDLPDPRDYQLQDHIPHAFKLGLEPEKLPAASRVIHPFDNDDQQWIGSCVPHGGAGAWEYVASLNPANRKFKLGKLSLYAWVRLLGGFPLSVDSGAYIRDICKVLANQGGADVAVDPYLPNNYQQTPSLTVELNASKHKALKYVSVPVDVNAIKAVIASGYPVIIGFSVTNNFFSTGADGMVPLPTGTIVGGHCVLIVGYDDVTGRFEIRNSWGTSWGKNGNAFMLYSHVVGYGADFWAITDVISETVTPPPVPPVPPTPTYVWSRDNGIEKSVEANPAYWGMKFINAGQVYGMNARWDFDLPTTCKLIKLAVTLVSGTVDVHDGLSASYTRVNGVGSTFFVNVVLDDKGICWFDSPSSGQIKSIKLVAYWP